MLRSKVDYVRQQGFTTEGCQDGLYSALMFQPRVIGGVVTLGIILHSPWVFLVLSAMLWWNAIVPTHNPFDAFYNHMMADPRQRFLSAAPPPRRFAQGMGGTFAMLIALMLFAELSLAAWLVEGVFAAAVAVVTFGRLCAGAEVYHLLWPRTPARQCRQPTTICGRAPLTGAAVPCPRRA
jgi:Domain of unknown function (DUF4395)